MGVSELENTLSSDPVICRNLDSSPRPLKIRRTVGDLSDDEEKNETVLPCEAPNRRTQRYLIAVEYIGTRFFGSQKQPNCRTVVGVLEEAFNKFIGHHVTVFCSSRTDAGVHALCNVCHVDIERTSKRKPDEVLPPHEPAVLQRALNHFLQKEDDIMVIDARLVSPDFHARYMAHGRMYYYRLLSGPESLSTFDKGRAWHVTEELDLFSMQKACEILAGHHDFSSFRASGCQASSAMRTLEELSIWEEVPFASCFSTIFPGQRARDISCSDKAGKEEAIIEAASFGVRKGHRCYVIKASARSFLYHQVRLIVGVLKSVGVGDLTVADVAKILEAKSVTAASPMAPACGLFLASVKYDMTSLDI